MSDCKSSLTMNFIRQNKNSVNPNPRKPFAKAARIMALAGLLSVGMAACDDSILDETPLSDLNTDAVLSTRSGFENYINALVLSARNELTNGDNWYRYINNTDRSEEHTSELQSRENLVC